MGLMTGMPAVAHAEDPLFRWNMPMRRGSFVLTDLTVATLLQSGYTLISVFEDTRLNLSAGAGISGSVPLASATTLYLQKGADLLRCSEELPAYTSMICWRLAPLPIEVNGKLQTDRDLNALVGTWVGTYRNDPTVKLTVKITDSPTDRAIVYTTSNSGGSRTFTVPVLFYEGSGQRVTARYNPAGNMNAFHNEAVFQVLGANRIAWLESPYDETTILIRDPDSMPGPEPGGAVQPSTTTVR